MRTIEGILFEPVGCLAEFPAEPFHQIATQFFGRRGKASKSGSREYWHLLNLMKVSRDVPDEVVDLEVEAVRQAALYEDVMPALSELKSMGVELRLASSLSKAAVKEFEAKCPGLFSQVWSRDDAGGIKDEPLRRASAALRREHTMYLADTSEGLKTAGSAGLIPILMMNDPDEARRLAMHEPAGGIVSLIELPDFVRIVAAERR